MELLGSISRHAHWALRIGLASVFLFHGPILFSKLSQWAESRDLPIAVAFFVPLAEVVGAVLILLGGFLKEALGDLATRLGALMFIPVLIGAIAMRHWPRWSFEPSESHPIGGMEFQVVLILISLYLIVKGNGVKTGEVSAGRT